MPKCARCGGTIDRLRHASSYCSDSCRDAAARAPWPAVPSTAAWRFGVHPALYMALDNRAPVRLWPQDLERVERARAKMTSAG